jgi:hypothetical protein
MATAAAINTVKMQIPDEAASLGFDDTAIGKVLDGGLSSSQTILTVLRGMMAKAASFEDVSESGSTRNSKFFDNLHRLIDVWQKIADKEDATTGTNKTKESIKFYTITRV